ncbi:unnamed protein product, partial [Phaeothamnion confervicola]
LVVLDFTATWCGPCNRVSPLFDALATRYPDCTFAKVWEHQNRELIMSCNVTAFPTFQFYIAGRKVDECRGGDIRAVEAKVLHHRASGVAAGGPSGTACSPIRAKLRLEREKPRQDGSGSVLVFEEVELEILPAEGLEVLQFQVLSLSGIEPDEHEITGGDGKPVTDDAGLAAALAQGGGGTYGNYAMLTVRRRRRPAAAATAAAATPTTAVKATVAAAARAAPAPAAAAVAAVAAAAARASAVADAYNDCCTRVFLGNDPVRQPAYVIREEHWEGASGGGGGGNGNGGRGNKGDEPLLLLCSACAEMCVLPDRREPAPAVSATLPFACEMATAAAKGHGTYFFGERAAAAAERLRPGTEARAAMAASLVAAAERVAATALAGVAAARGRSETDMLGRIRGGVQTVLRYEDPALQREALAVVPAAELRAKAQAAGGDRLTYEEALVLVLLQWFKRDFFSWCNKPPCSFCGVRGDNMEAAGSAGATLEERMYHAGVVELYDCRKCHQQTRFPRYNHPGKLLQTRTGRCGEYANCFTLICRAMGLDVRYVLDWTDHVWTEVWAPRPQPSGGDCGGVWLHADSCENKLDKPLMYEKGWGKRLSYVLAFHHRGGVADVTPRYTRRWRQVLCRRTAVPEGWLASQLAAQSQALAS